MNGVNLLRQPFLWLLMLLALVWLASSQVPDRNLHVVFCDVGQGDAALISFGSVQVLIDGGPDGRVLDCLGREMPFWDKRLEMVVLTHAEEDHAGGLIDVFRRYRVGYFVANGIANDTPVFWELQGLVAKSGTATYLPQTGDVISLGNLRFRVLWPKQRLGEMFVWQTAGLSDRQKVLGAVNFSGEINDTAVVVELDFSDFQVLFTGDLSSDYETGLKLADVDILKVAHHGSRFSTGRQFLEVIKPELAVVSVGENSFGHPTQEVLERLAEAGAAVKRTDKDGAVKIASDGEGWWVER